MVDYVNCLADYVNCLADYVNCLADYVGRKTVIIPLLLCVAGSGIYSLFFILVFKIFRVISFQKGNLGTFLFSLLGGK